MMKRRSYRPIPLAALIIAALLLATVSPAVGGQDRTAGGTPQEARSGGGAGLFREAAVREKTPFAGEPEVARARYVEVDFGALRRPEGGVARTLALNLFDDASFSAVLDRVESDPSGSYTWVGRLAGVELSLVTLVVGGGTLTGQIFAGTGIYQVRSLGSGGLHAVIQIDQSALPPEADPIPWQAETAGGTPGGKAPAAGLTSAGDGQVIDVMVVYTAAARTGAGGTTAAIESLIRAAISETNSTYANSGITRRLGLVHMEEVAYTESGNLGTDLPRLANPVDGHMDGVHTLRDTYHADHVVLLVETDPNYCGMAYLMTTVSTAFQSLAFAVVKRSCATGTLSFGHELGHNNGVRHDWFEDGLTTPYTYAHGFVNLADTWRTIMAYNDWCDCSDEDTPCPASGSRATPGSPYCSRLPYWSTPLISYGGDPLGVAGGSSSSCNEWSYSPDPATCDADASRTQNETATTCDSFRDSEIRWTGASGTDWNTAANWEMEEGAPGLTSTVNRVPRAIDDVVIPASASNMPAISGTAYARELIVEDGAQLSMSGSTLTVYGDWLEQGSGQFTATGGTVIFAGSFEQTLTSGAASNFYDLQIGDGTGTQAVSAGSRLQVAGSLTVAAGASLDTGSGADVDVGGNLDMGPDSFFDISHGADLDVNGDLSIGSGASLDGGSSTLHVAGDWDDQGFSFMPGTSTVILDGASQSLLKSTSSTLLTQNFSDYDGMTLNTYTSGPPPAGWTTVQEGPGTAPWFGWWFGRASWYAGGGFTIRWRNSSESPAYVDAWLYSPAVELSPGATYRLEFIYTVWSSADDQDLYAWLGTSRTPAAMTQQIFGVTGATNLNWIQVSEEFTVPTAGTYYLGFQNYDNPYTTTGGGQGAAMDNIVLTGEEQLAFYNLTVASTGSATPGGDLKVNNDLLVDSGGTLDLAGHALSVEGTLTNDGTLRQTLDAPATTTTPFLHVQNAAGTADKYFGLDLYPTSGAMDATTVSISGAQTCSGFGASVQRCFEIAPGTTRTANVTFYFRDAEQNGQAAPQVYHWSGSAWLPEVVAASDLSGTEDNWVRATGVDEYSPFALADAPPTAVDLLSFTAAPQDPAILLRWETASEVDNLGFHLYRAASPDGPGERLNGALIPVQYPGSSIGAVYTWLDEEVEPGITYYYWLEDVDVGGLATRHGPVAAALKRLEERQLPIRRRH